MELTQITNETIWLLAGGFCYTPDEIRARVDGCIQRIEAWASDISARQLCAFMLNEIRISLKAMVLTTEALETSVQLD